LAERQAEESRKSRAEKLRKNKELAQSLQEEVDYYHEIEEVISDLSREMDRLSEKKERAFGKNKVKLMQEELAVLDSEIKAQDILIERVKAKNKADKENLLKTNKNVIIDKNTGNITNYEEIKNNYL
jgi:hypothetical protein